MIYYEELKIVDIKYLEKLNFLDFKSLISKVQGEI